MNKFSDLSDRLTDLTYMQSGEIRKLFNEILEEYNSLEKRYNEVESQCIHYETSLQLGIGYEVLQYGKIYNAIEKANNLEECLKNINNLYKLELFESDCQLLDQVEEKILDLEEKNDYKFYNMQGEILCEIANNYILDSVIEKSKN